MTPRAESMSIGPSFVATSSGMDHLRGSLVFTCRPVTRRVLWKFLLCSVVSPGVQDRGSSSIILARPYPEGSSHDVVTFAWFCEVGGSRLLEMTRIPPSDLLTDEKSLTTSAPQSQRRESRCLGFVLVEASLLGKHVLPSEEAICGSDSGYAESSCCLEGRHARW